ncbi:tRNA/tmRNA/rRNA uracil-C5-methylase, TrmA/RlmC/RlmD family [Actinopolymorpha cephalotaxi]|uniref:tRNA/tmRNA/rRNA uracil-C5-methylase (TrmA/RlmC/RlmD family) n=1 Tax=Actinopolymorpha cephalotaxi TaxID=504797 RepID=A0A1I2YG99_9ACTN|nr:class I SAM-dependent RNA methyltransferase [Actinopolymorpha cephalotaxi]NYH87009.1 tRNA/tmRNA/rRNA uracil-C5-methylase (TrmA/RlmC/RlmD family) [Actinopolymorpha cephalotaxi]SFH24086.1 tRNA/tmRNA/rRNA uracil-C5-methylase, TrmA/RlmC/RlmD family [Actinopolymorpha cephalotaxi]
MNDSDGTDAHPDAGRERDPGGLVGTVLELEIGPVAHGGWCVAHHDGKVAFVRHALPGERVRAHVVEETARLLRADAIEVLAASPDRVTPPCPFAGPGRCGGCDWQHATLPAQRRLKAAVVEDQLRRIAGIERSVEVEALPEDPDEFGDEGADDGLGWRTRVQFAVRRDGAIGFRRHRSHDIEPVDECLIAHPEVEVLGIERRRWPGAARVEGIASAATGDRVVAVSGRGPKARVRVPRLAAPVRILHGQPRPGPGLPYVREVAAGRTWQVSGAGFWQVHPGAAQALADAVVAGLAPRTDESVLDLYCGVGLFLGALADSVGPSAPLVGVEENALAVRDARHNLRDLPNATVEQGRVDVVLGRLDQADLVVLDPPRAGLGVDVVRQVAGLAGRAIGYVSCDPATLARDLGYFAEHGWELTGLRAFDAFPMTHHVECVAILHRAGPTQ